MEPEKAVCAGAHRAAELVCTFVCMHMCFYMQVWAAVMHDFVLNIQILMHLCSLLLCMEMWKYIYTPLFV